MSLFFNYFKPTSILPGSWDANPPLCYVSLLPFGLEYFHVWSVIFHVHWIFSGGGSSLGILYTMHCRSVMTDEQGLVCLCWEHQGLHHPDQDYTLISELWALFNEGRSGASVSFFLSHLEPQEERHSLAVSLACVCVCGGGGYSLDPLSQRRQLFQDTFCRGFSSSFLPYTNPSPCLLTSRWC